MRLRNSLRLKFRTRNSLGNGVGYLIWYGYVLIEPSGLRTLAAPSDQNTLERHLLLGRQFDPTVRVKIQQRFQSLAGFRILRAGFRIPKPRIPRFHSQKFPGSRIPQVRMFNNYSSSLNGLWVNSGRMGYWLRGHEGKRNNISVKSNWLVKNIENKKFLAT